MLQAGDLLVLTGELGAGKTTFTQGLGVGLGVRAGIISPTFVLVRIHPNLPEGPRPGGPELVHVDAYRLESAAEIDDIDLENTMDSAVTVVEWGRGRVEHLSDSRLEVELHRTRGGAAASAEPPAPAEPAPVPFWISTRTTTTSRGPSSSAASARAGLKPRRCPAPSLAWPCPGPRPRPRNGIPDADPRHRHLSCRQRRPGLR